MPNKIVQGIILAVLPSIFFRIVSNDLAVIDFGILPEPPQYFTIHKIIISGIFALGAGLCCDRHDTMYGFCIAMVGVILSTIIPIGYTILITVSVWSIICLLKSEWYLYTKRNPFLE